MREAMTCGQPRRFDGKFTLIFIFCIISLAFLTSCGSNSLCDAVRAKDIRKVQHLLSEGCDVNSTDSHGNTCLFYAENAEMARLLIKSGADPRLKNHLGDEAVHFAAYRGDVGIVQLLVEAGVSVDARGGAWDFTVLHWATLDIIDNAGARSSLPLGPQNVEGMVDVVLYLASRGADVNVKNSSGETPLHFASMLDPRLVKALLDSGADPKAVDNFGETPLLRARSSDESKTMIQAAIDKTEGAENATDDSR